MTAALGNLAPQRLTWRQRFLSLDGQPPGVLAAVGEPAEATARERDTASG
ncbi:hypothetical protein [Pseudomonas sp. BN415]|nr:hypothetical protein [Pseudomonas sp. BN415]